MVPQGLSQVVLGVSVLNTRERGVLALVPWFFLTVDQRQTIRRLRDLDQDVWGVLSVSGGLG